MVVAEHVKMLLVPQHPHRQPLVRTPEGLGMRDTGGKTGQDETLKQKNQSLIFKLESNFNNVQRLKTCNENLGREGFINLNCAPNEGKPAVRRNFQTINQNFLITKTRQGRFTGLRAPNYRNILFVKPSPGDSKYTHHQLAYLTLEQQ